MLEKAIQTDEIKRETFGLPEAHTNNQAEYHALIRGLEAAVEIVHDEERRRTHTVVVMDSQLVINQLSDKYATKNVVLGQLKRQVNVLLDQLGRTELHWAGRSIIQEFLGH
jgi:ribonuclease HI